MADQIKKHYKILGLDFPLFGNKCIYLAIGIFMILISSLAFLHLIEVYKFNNADIPGGLMASLLFAYLILLVRE